MSTTDRYATWDAAYVLGSLPPAERAEFEQHLATCDACRTGVGELAGMPGLLAQVPPAEAWAMADETGGDADGTRTVGAAAAPGSPTRRPRWWQLAAAAALVALAAGLGGYGVRALVEPAPPSRLAFTPVSPSAMTAVVDLAPAPSGTAVDVECQYGEQTAGETFSIWVVDRAGRGSEVRPWTVRPFRVMHPSGTSPLPLAAIGAVEIRSGDQGPVVLRAVR